MITQYHSPRLRRVFDGDVIRVEVSHLQENGAEKWEPVRTYNGRSNDRASTESRDLAVYLLSQSIHNPKGKT